MKKWALFLAAILTLPSLSSARIFYEGQYLPRLLDTPNTQTRVHTASNIIFTVNNFGVLGSYDGMYQDPDFPGYPPGAEFPAWSGLDNLFMGAIWIGAEIDTVDSLGNPIVDTLVSVGNDGWWGQVYELFPPTAEYPSMWRDTTMADDEIFAIYSDTAIDARYVNPDPYDGPHIPLGINITQHSMCWTSPEYNEIFLIYFILQNIGARNIRNLWFGIFYDGDIYHESENPYGAEQGAQDDLCGFLERGGSSGIAYIIDNDGQPYGGQYDYRSSINAMGFTLLHSSEPNLQNTFNWWIPNINSQHDWGPQWQSNFDRWGRFPGGGIGTPGGDKAKYQVMSNGEWDYDQIWCGLDQTGSGWIPRPEHYQSISNGYDTRYLLSYGPIQLAPDETDTLVFGYVGGANIHTDPYNYFENLQYAVGNDSVPYDSASVALYYANLDFSDLEAKADTALSVFLGGAEQIPVGPPGGFHMTSWSENHVSLAWRPQNHPLLQQYRIYRGTRSGLYNPTPITPDGLLDTTFTDNTVLDDTTYYYAILSVKNNGLEGGYSREVAINVGIPHSPTELGATGGNGQITLNWQPSTPDDDIFGYLIYSGIVDTSLAVIDTARSNSYVHTGLDNSQRYFYSIRALDFSGNVSALTDTINAIPFSRDLGILLIDANYQGDRNPDLRLMRHFYMDALEGYYYTITSIPPDSLSQLARYSTVIWAKELSIGDDYLIPSNLTNLLTDYLDNGGNLLVEGTRNIVSPLNFQGVKTFGREEFQYKYLNLAGAIFPHFSYSTEFVGGERLDLRFNDFSLDSARVNRIVFPREDSSGCLMGIGTLIPNDSAEVIYTYRAINPDTSHLNGSPVAIIHHGNNFKTATLEFPLYFVREAESIAILHAILNDFEERRVDVVEIGSQLPDEFALLQNYPNPFNNATSIIYTLPEDGDVSLAIYNILGQEVALLFNGHSNAGRYSVTWDAAGNPSGLYFAQLKGEKSSKTVKLILLK